MNNNEIISDIQVIKNQLKLHLDQLYILADAIQDTNLPEQSKNSVEEAYSLLRKVTLKLSEIK